MSILYGTKINQLLAKIAPTGLLFKNEKKRQDCQNSSLKNCLIQYESVFFAEQKWQFCRNISIDILCRYMEQRYVSKDGKWQRKQLEADFVVNEGSQKYYIQSALAMPDEEKRKQEMASLLRIGDSFKKIIIVKDDIKPWTDENGILTMGLMDFLMGDTKDLNI